MQLLEVGLQGIGYLDQPSMCSFLKARMIIKYQEKNPCSDRQVYFVAAGKMIAHSALYRGPGISPAVIHYWSVEDVSLEELSGNRPPVILEDIPDINLREIVSQVN